MLGLGLFAGLGTVFAVFALRGADPSPEPLPDPVTIEANHAQQAHQDVAERARALMLRNNCTPLVEATDLRGAYDLVNTLQSAPNSPCVTLLAASGRDDNALKLWLSDPSGVVIKTPELAPSLQFRHCASQTGSHPARIVPQTDQSYTLAVLECPR